MSEVAVTYGDLADVPLEDLRSLLLEQLGKQPVLIGDVSIKEKSRGRFLVRVECSDGELRRETLSLMLDRPEGVRLWCGMDVLDTPKSAGLYLLRLAVRVLPVGERAEWLEEQRGYLADLLTRRQRWSWILATLMAMPRFAYTVRTGAEKETA
ncbi:hypothetical protein H4W23_00435 [Streptomyces gardneri]|uniref:hypothetical protein n=1 Tax=Streptomyces gardneri TaxID=66892 RepID=UPI0006BE0104|nr:hypothetical protein [Streptomyces gardneri]QPK43272.1 hypothetical protein H4W23_00435 [Streptomyces gardneri]WRK34490.1 hypothetical protein U0M97_00420 [Streptomyces venezuelae]CUM44132.1 hypothetical protein BN2537_17229 [Streptomyces venezuelae]